MNFRRFNSNIPKRLKARLVLLLESLTGLLVEDQLLTNQHETKCFLAGGSTFPILSSGRNRRASNCLALIHGRMGFDLKETVWTGTHKRMDSSGTTKLENVPKQTGLVGAIPTLFQTKRITQCKMVKKWFVSMTSFLRR